MHYNGFLKKLLDYLNIEIDNSHINHHKQTMLNQTLPDDYIEEGLVFNLIDSEILYTLIFFVVGTILFWLFFPKFKKSFSLLFMIIFSVVFISVYMYIWSSIHSHYHSRYVESNKPLKNNPKITIYSPLPFFIPHESSYIYKYLYWYHSLHHLNKGEDKGNYNILIPFFDFIFGTYKYKVDNTKYFLNNSPKTPQEIWLKQHIIFDIRVVDNNILEYKDESSNIWQKLPSI
jgi:hypothetical protein